MPRGAGVTEHSNVSQMLESSTKLNHLQTSCIRLTNTWVAYDWWLKLRRGGRM
jgi:hypothetical protein